MAIKTSFSLLFTSEYWTRAESISEKELYENNYIVSCLGAAERLLK
jgi:hypothetical protein